MQSFIREMWANYLFQYMKSVWIKAKSSHCRMQPKLIDHCSGCPNLNHFIYIVKLDKSICLRPFVHFCVHHIKSIWQIIHVYSFSLRVSQIYLEIYLLLLFYVFLVGSHMPRSDLHNRFLCGCAALRCPANLASFSVCCDV